MNCCSSYCKRTKNYRLFEKGRDLLEKEIDIAHFIQQYRLLQRIVALKIKLSNEEKTYVNNNRFTKLQISGSDSDNDDFNNIRPQNSFTMDLNRSSTSDLPDH